MTSALFEILLAVFVLFLVPIHCRVQNSGQVVNVFSNQSPASTTQFQSNDEVGKKLHYLDFSECHEAEGSKNGLMCTKQGFFISSFQQTVLWDPGQLFPRQYLKVPASKAVCCRIGLPEKLPEDVAEILPNGAEPVGVMSVGCHTSSNSGIRTMQCEQEGHSFMTGFLNALNPQNSPGTFYPVDGTECCTPVMLLSNGDSFEIERCDCQTASSDVSCGTETNRLLWGFEYCGRAGTHLVPLAPAMCCRVCLGKKVHDMTLCSDLNSCSGNGVCVMGGCECLPGYSGSDCSMSVDPSSGDEWWQSFWWLGVIGFMCAFTGLFATFWMIQRAEWAERGNRGEAEDPLLDWVHGEGSVGTHDTNTTDDASSAASVCINVQIRNRSQGSAEGEGGGLGNRELDQESVGSTVLIHARLRRRDGNEGEPASPAGSAVSGQLQDDPSDPTNRVECNPTDENISREAGESVGDASDAPQEIQEEVSGDEKGEDKLTLEFNGVRSPLQNVVCAICMGKPVQVALVPCGHSNMCRRCSRKLRRCPFCRKEIVRRQRLYLSG